MSTQEELQELDEDLARLRAEASELRGQVGDIGPTDAVERSTLINMADEREARAAELETRREELLKRLGEE
jgi:prefoldin subunit 5